MRFGRFILLSCGLFFVSSLRGQQVADPQQAPTLSPIQDPQAVSVLNQAISSAGGLPAIGAVSAYTASGTITIHSSQDIQGSITLKGLGVFAFRADSTFSEGTQSYVIHEGRIGTKAGDGTTSWNPPQLTTADQGPPPLVSSDVYFYRPFKVPLFPSGLAFPYLQLATALNGSPCSISFKGPAEVDGRSTDDIRIQWGVIRTSPGGAVPSVALAPANSEIDPLNEYNTMDFFIDPSTFQVLMIRDVFPKDIVKEIRYADYRLVKGVLMPFSIGEQMNGHKTIDIQIGQFTFNSGLQDSDFAL